MTFTEFLSANLRDADRRLGRLIAPVRDDEGALWRLVDESAAGRASTWLAAQWRRVRSTSRVVALSGAAAGAWGGYDARVRMRMSGVATLMAVAVHVVLVAPTAPVGAWWLILPGIAAAFGVVALLASWPVGRS